MSKKQNAPRARRTPQVEVDAVVDEVVERANAMEEKVSRQARAESDANAERAEGQQVGNGLVAVVGVGASAGGLEAFKQFLKHLPVDTGMAFVLVTHLDPKHESILPELLARATQLSGARSRTGRPSRPITFTSCRAARAWRSKAARYDCGPARRGACRAIR
jgi:chemotaxis response regulator CheB